MTHIVPIFNEYPLYQSIHTLSIAGKNATVEPLTRETLERMLQAWISGSILGSLGAFTTVAISKDDYEKSDPQFAHKKCFRI